MTHKLFLYKCTCIPNNIGVVRLADSNKTFKCAFCGKFCKFLKFIEKKEDWND